MPVIFDTRNICIVYNMYIKMIPYKDVTDRDVFQIIYILLSAVMFSETYFNSIL